MWCDGTMMSWMWVGGAFWLLLAVVVVLFFARDRIPGARQQTSLTDHDSALDVLRRRFASGEIDEQEYRARLEVLEIDNQK
jgi:putative membrane protein